MTRTRTYYWSAEDVEPLSEALAKLRADFTDRRPYIDALQRLAMEKRLAILEAAALLLCEAAD